MTVDIGILKLATYFVGLSEAELEKFKKLIFQKTVEKGEVIVREGEPSETLYFVAGGVVKVFKTSAEGREQILTLVRPAESFNDVPVFAGANLASAEAMMPVTLYGLRKTDFQNILREYPQLALNAIQVLAKRVELLVALVEDLSFRQVTGRVARILYEYVRGKDVNRPRITQQEMAAMAGTAREMVGRSLRVLEEEGTIRMDRNRIVITNEAALKKEAGIA
jgi:CRP/FNR family transcriptional regulator